MATISRSVRFSLLAAGITAAALTGGCNGPTKAGIEAREEAKGRFDQFSARFVYDQARQEYLAGRLDRAMTTIDRAISMAPDRPGYLVMRGRILLEAGRLEDAVEAFEVALEMDETSAESLYYLGIVAQRLAEDEVAFERYSAAFEIDPNNAQYLVAAAEMLVQSNRLDEARTLCEEHLVAFENEPAMLQLIAQIAMLEGDPGVAVTKLEQARLLQPDDMAILNEYAHACFDAELYPEAMRAIETLQDDAENGIKRPDLDRLEARTLTMLGQLRDASPIYRDLTKTHGTDVTIWLEYAGLCWAQKEWPRLKECSIRISKLDPDLAEGPLFLGLVERADGNLDAAAKAFNLAADKPNSGALPLMLLGQLEESRGDFDAAAAAYEAALKADPENVEAETLRARVLARASGE